MQQLAHGMAHGRPSDNAYSFTKQKRHVLAHILWKADAKMGIIHAGDLLRGTSVKDKREEAGVSEKDFRPSCRSDTYERKGGRKSDWVGKVSDCCTIPRKFGAVWCRVLKPTSSVGGVLPLRSEPVQSLVGNIPGEARALCECGSASRKIAASDVGACVRRGKYSVSVIATGACLSWYFGTMANKSLVLTDQGMPSLQFSCGAGSAYSVSEPRFYDLWNGSNASIIHLFQDGFKDVRYYV